MLSSYYRVMGGGGAAMVGMVVEKRKREEGREQTQRWEEQLPISIISRSPDTQDSHISLWIPGSNQLKNDSTF